MPDTNKGRKARQVCYTNISTARGYHLDWMFRRKVCTDESSYKVSQHASFPFLLLYTAQNLGSNSPTASQEAKTTAHPYAQLEFKFQTIYM